MCENEYLKKVLNKMNKHVNSDYWFKKSLDLDSLLSTCVLNLGHWELCRVTQATLKARPKAGDPQNSQMVETASNRAKEKEIH